MINFLHTGFMVGYITHKQIVEWADRELMSEVSEYPNKWLIEVSLSTNYNQLESALKKIKDDNNIFDNYISLFRTLREKKLLDWNIIVTELLECFNICFDSFVDYNYTEINDQYDSFFLSLSDYLGLIHEKFTPNMDMPTELDEFLSNYQEDIQIFRDLNFNVCGVDISSI